MHDVTEGGVLGALWEMARASGCGVLVEREKVPVLPVTRKICARLALDPLRLISSGSMLMTASDGAAVAGGLIAAGVPAVGIGRTTQSGLFMTGPDGDDSHRTAGRRRTVQGSGLIRRQKRQS